MNMTTDKNIEIGYIEPDDYIPKEIWEEIEKEIEEQENSSK